MGYVHLATDSVSEGAGGVCLWAGELKDEETGEEVLFKVALPPRFSVALKDSVRRIYGREGSGEVVLSFVQPGFKEWERKAFEEFLKAKKGSVARENLFAGSVPDDGRRRFYGITGTAKFREGEYPFALAVALFSEPESPEGVLEKVRDLFERFLRNTLPREKEIEKILSSITGRTVRVKILASQNIGRIAYGGLSSGASFLLQEEEVAGEKEYSLMISQEAVLKGLGETFGLGAMVGLLMSEGDLCFANRREEELLQKVRDLEKFRLLAPSASSPLEAALAGFFRSVSEDRVKRAIVAAYATVSASCLLGTKERVVQHLKEKTETLLRNAEALPPPLRLAQVISLLQSFKALSLFGVSVESYLRRLLPHEREFIEELLRP